MIDLLNHSPGTMQGADSPASIAMPGTAALTATVTNDPGTIAVKSPMSDQITPATKLSPPKFSQEQQDHQYDHAS
jgi:hypothetical protein